MYTIVPVKKKVPMGMQDYVFENFENFYALAELISFPLVGRYTIAVRTENTKEIEEFIKISSKFGSLVITIFTSEAAASYLALYNTNLPIKGMVSAYDTFVGIIEEKQLLFAKGVIYLLYASIEHDFANMEDALNIIIAEYGKEALITEEKLAALFVLNKVVYPRSVLIEYINLGRYRASKRDKCLSDVGNDVCLGAMLKNINVFVKGKIEYFKTGKGSKFIKNLNTRNLCLMYRVFVLERGGVNDVCLLLEFYERGVSADDIVQRRVY